MMTAQHGKLTLGESVIVGTLEHDKGNYYSVQPDGGKGFNALYKPDGWVFTPDPEPLPTEPGTVIEVKGHWYLLLPTGERWYDITYEISYLMDTMQADVNSNGFRVVSRPVKERI